MDERTDILRLNDRQKTRLLSLGLEPDRPAAMPDGDEQRGDLLCDILRRPLPPDGRGQSDGSSDPNKLCTAFRTLAGPPLRELLLDPNTDVAVLCRVKEYAKALGQKAGSEVEKDVFLAVYFAAIAVAELFHSQRITEHSDADLVQFLESFAGSSWMPIDLVRLLAEASRGHPRGT